MAKLVEDDPFGHIGQAEEDPFGNIGASSPLGREMLRQGIDVAKQAPSAVVGATEAALTAPAQVTGLLGGLVEKIPGFAPSPQEAENRAKLLELTSGARKPFTRYVPDPETRAGAVTRTGLETALTTAFSPFRGGLSIPRAAGVGATAGVTGEIAGQATEGTPVEPYARVGGTLVGGTAAARQSERAATRALIPTIEQTEARGAQLYDQFRQSGLHYNPQISPNFSQGIKTELQSRGLTDSPDVASGAWNALTRALETNRAQTPQDFHTLYQELGHVARGTQNNSQRLAANIAQERLLQFMENTPQGALTGNVNAPAQAVEALREANQDWAAAQRAKAVSGKITKAEQKAASTYSGLNLENELRRRIGIFADPELARRSGFSPEEIRRFDQFTRGTGPLNTLRYIGNIAGGGGGLGAGLTGGAGAYFLGNDPVTSGAAGLASLLGGRGLRASSNAIALARARDLERMLLTRSPLAAGRAVPQQPLLPLGALPPTIANLGE